MFKPYLPPYLKYSTKCLLALFVFGLLLTFLLVWVCLNPKYGGDFGSSRTGTSKWFFLAMVVVMDFSSYKDWQKGIALDRARKRNEPEENKPLCVNEESTRKRRVAIAAAILAGSLIIAAAQLLYPGGPTQGWQFSVASVVTTTVFLLAELIFGREE